MSGLVLLARALLLLRLPLSRRKTQDTGSEAVRQHLAAQSSGLSASIPNSSPSQSSDVVVQLRCAQQIILKNSLVENRGPVRKFYKPAEVYFDSEGLDRCRREKTAEEDLFEKSFPRIG